MRLFRFQSGDTESWARILDVAVGEELCGVVASCTGSGIVVKVQCDTTFDAQNEKAKTYVFLFSFF